MVSGPPIAPLPENETGLYWIHWPGSIHVLRVPLPFGLVHSRTKRPGSPHLQHAGLLFGPLALPAGLAFDLEFAFTLALGPLLLRLLGVHHVSSDPLARVFIPSRL